MKNYILFGLLCMSLSMAAQPKEKLLGGREIKLKVRSFAYAQAGVSMMKWVNTFEVPTSFHSSTGGGLFLTTRYAGLALGMEVGFFEVESPLVEEQIEFMSPNFTFALAIEPVKNLILTAGPKYNWTISNSGVQDARNLILQRKYWSLGFSSDYVVGKWMLGVNSTIGLQPVASFREGGGPMPGKVSTVQARVSYLLSS
ncbi:MAG: hypothetical protein AB8F78_10915 [Saprospiraceae bacterium]